jgi:hypothetical protein
MSWQKYIDYYLKSPTVSQNLKLLVQNGVQVYPTSYTSLIPIASLIQGHLLTNPPKRNLCYQNSWGLAQSIPGVNYVEGFLKIKFSLYTQTVSHAWLEYGGSHFDITPLTPFDRVLGSRISSDYFHFYTVRHADISKKDAAFRGITKGPFSETDVT